MASWNDLQAARQNDLMRYYNSKVVQQDQATPQSAALQEKKNKGGFLGGVGYTLEKLGLGTLRSIEGMTDYLVGGAADILGQDDFAEELMKSDWVNYEHADEWYNPNKVMSFVGDVSSGVGGMLPSITAAAAVTLATGGATGAGVGAGLLSQGVGTALFGLGAAGQSTSQAVKETGTLGGKEWLYGTGSGALEAGIEAASGGIGGTLAGTAFGKQLAKTTGGKIATTFLGEGLEEVASDITDPLLKKATGVDKKAKVDWSNLPRTFLVGGATGAVLGGAGRAINAAKAGGFNNLSAIETANKLTKEKAKVNLQQVNDKAFEQEQPQAQATESQEQTEQTPTPTVVEENQKPIKYAYTPQEIRETENRLGERVQKMDEKTRQEFMESNPQATRNLNEDGTVKPAVTVTQDEIDTYDKNSYSASLQGHEGEFEYTPSKKPTQVIKNVMKKLTQLTQGKAEIVLTDNDLGKTAGGKKINGLVKNGIIYLKADSTDAERTMFVGSHEIMHTLEGTREYSNLAKFIQSEIKNNPRMRLKYNLEDYISAYAGSQEQNYSNYTKLHEAQTEMYADFVANEILSNPDSVNRLVKDNRNLVKKMLDWVRNALKRIGMTKDERETYDTLRRMEKLLSNALEAGSGGMALNAVERRYQERKAQEQAQESAKEKPFRGTFAAERYSFSSISNSFFGEELTVEDFESKDYKETEGYKEYVDKCLSNMKQTREDFNEEETRKEITNSIDGIVKVAVAMKKAGYDILDDSDQREAVDSKNRKLFSSLEPNSDYFTSSDISTICDKRRNFTSIYEDIVEREEKANVPADKRFFNNIDNYFYIHEVMAKLGLTTACRQCYVESMRKNLAPMARAFITLVTEPNANNKANRQLFDNKGNAKATNTRLRENVLNAIAENDYSIKAADLTYTMLTTADGLAQLKLQAPIVYEAFNSFYGQAKPKMPKKATPFRFGELTALLTDNKGKINEGLVNRINKTGGFRLQSYSDFQMENYADVLQVIFEAGTLGLTGHAYTKVPAFLDATANTNLKRNISVFMYEDNGKWIIDKGDSFPATMEQLADIVKADKSGNTGVIAVVQNEKMAAYVMVNDNIAYFIPYHKSGMKMDVVRETIVKDKGREILGYKNIKDHTKMQSETWKTNTAEHKQFTKVKTPIDIYSFWDFDNVDNLPKKELIEKNVKEYINRCEAAGYYPKFRNYVMNNEAVLKDMVTYAKELGIDASLDTLTFKYKEYTIPYGYYKCLGDFSMFKPNGEASPHEVLSLKNYKFNEAVKFFDDSKKLRRTEILQQIANGELREELAKSDLTDKQIEEIVKQKRTKAADIALEERGYKGKNERFSLQVGDDNVSFTGKYFDASQKENTRLSLNVTAEEDAEYMTDEEWEATLDKEHEDDGRVAKFQRVTQEKEKLTKKERIEKVKATVADAWLRGQIETTNQQAGIEHAGKKLGVDLEPKIQKARASQSAAINMVTNEQRDYTGKKRVGKSINEIFTPILKKGDETYDAFLEYLGHFHNVDSMSFEKKAKAEMIQLVKSNEKLKEIVTQKNITETERNAKLKEFEEGLRYLALKDIENKPVYGWSVGVEESQERIKELNEKYPEFFAKAQEVWNYNKNLVQRRVDSGLITQELADVLLAKYPHYIPTFRDTSKSGVASTGTSNSKNAVEVRKTIKTRKGSSLDILDVMVSMSKQTQSVLRAEAVNDLANALYDAAEASNDFTDIEIISKTKVAEEIATAENGDIDYEAEKPKNNEVVFYRNGERIVAAVSQPVFIGFEGFNGGMQFKGPIVNTLEKWMNFFKSIVTAWNPLFTIRNFIRDFQEAAFYTKHGVGKFSANLPKAIAAMKRKSDLWQQYLAIGGIQSGFFDKDTGIFDSSGKIKKGLKAVGGKISLINEFVEQIPRFNEFMLSVESGKSIEQALLDSADVTTNFSRGGRATKVMNRTLVPFMNASVQGFSKLWRTATGRKTARQWANLIVKATLFGLSVGLINDLINGDDEEYEKLNMREKENNYILKAGDVFIKIPKGRVVAFLGSFVGRTKDFVSGKEDAFDEWVTSAMSMVTPADSVTRTILAPFSDIKSNTTWYGGQIEGQRLQNYAPSQRYDESTSSIAIALGKVFNYSPKKIHYLIDQYSGVFGDVLLPLTTNKAERGMIESAFTIDPVTQNNISNEFYDTLDSLTWAKNAGDPISAILLRYMNKASNGVSELYQQKRDIANDKSLSNKEKQEQTRILQATINGTLNAATQSVEKLEQILIDSGYEKQSVSLVNNKTFMNFSDTQKTSATQKFTDYYYAKAMAELVGEQQAVKVALYDEFGAVEASIYLTEIAAIMSEKDANGKTIPNSRKEKVHAYIEKLKISALNKYILMYLAGYIPSENGKAKIQQYLIGKGYKQEEVKNLWN